MGADLIAFVVKGPEKFSKKAIKKAEQRAEEIIIFAAKILELLQKRNNEDGPSLSSEEETVLEEALKNPLLEDFNWQEQFSDIIECEEPLEEMAAATPKDLVAEFIHWWTTCSGGDTCGRSDPDDKKQQIVVCGEMSYGDSPQGHGYQLMRKAYWYSIPTSLGVR